VRLIDFYQYLLSYDYISQADAFDIIESFFNVSKEEFIINKDKEINNGISQKIIGKVKRKVPVAYIIGYVDFLNVKIKVNRNVLIPRPETEEMVRYVLKNIDLKNKRILDLCTGTGCIAVSLKKQIKKVEVDASDISEKALKVAKENAKENNVDVKFIKSDYLNQIEDKYDLIISNPPYIPYSSKTETLYEPKLALFANENGLEAYIKIFKDIKNKLKDNGQAIFEMQFDQGKRLVNLSKELIDQNVKTELIKDLEGKERFLLIKIR